MISTIKSMGNPQAMLEQMMQQNSPELAKALEYVKQNGGNYKTAFEKLAAEKGIKPEDLGL